MNRDEQLNLLAKLKNVIINSDSDDAGIDRVISFSSRINSNLNMANWVDKEGNAPLHWLADGNNKITLSERESMIAICVRYGGDINLVNQSGITPLLMAAASKLPEIIFQLLSHGANINAQDASGKTMLHYLFQALAEEKRLTSQYQIIKFIIALVIYTDDDDYDYIDIGAQDNEGNTVLHSALHSYEAMFVDNAEEKEVPKGLLTLIIEQCVKHLIKSESDELIDTKNNEGETPLQLAARYNISLLHPFLMNDKEALEMDEEDEEDEYIDWELYEKRIRIMLLENPEIDNPGFENYPDPLPNLSGIWDQIESEVEAMKREMAATLIPGTTCFLWKVYQEKDVNKLATLFSNEMIENDIRLRLESSDFAAQFPTEYKDHLKTTLTQHLETGIVRRDALLGAINYLYDENKQDYTPKLDKPIIRKILENLPTNQLQEIAKQKQLEEDLSTEANKKQAVSATDLFDQPSHSQEMVDATHSQQHPPSQGSFFQNRSRKRTLEADESHDEKRQMRLL